MGHYETIPPAYVIKAEELSALNYIDPDHPQPLLYEWINRGTDQKLRRTTIDMLLRTLFQDEASPSVARLHQSAGLRVLFTSNLERDRFAAAFLGARAQESLGIRHRVTSIFNSREDAEQAVAELKDAGIPQESISLLFKTGDYMAAIGGQIEGHSKLSVAASVAGGGVAGTILGVALLAIPGVGPVAAAGALAASAYSSMAAFGAAMGATGGAIARMLTDHDVEGHAANYYEKQIQRGRVFVSIDTRVAEGLRDIALQVLMRNGGQAASRA